MMKHVLSIAGTDPSGGAGAAADCKTFCAHGCFALNVITAVVSQNTQGGSRVYGRHAGTDCIADRCRL